MASVPRVRLPLATEPSSPAAARVAGVHGSSGSCIPVQQARSAVITAALQSAILPNVIVVA